jgi:hypothetical protein
MSRPLVPKFQSQSRPSKFPCEPHQPRFIAGTSVSSNARLVARSSGLEIRTSMSPRFRPGG